MRPLFAIIAATSLALLVSSALAPAGETQTGVQLADSAHQHWAFQLLADVELPSIDGVSNPVDAFVRHRLAELKLVPSKRADVRTLVRRTYLSLVGVPPTFEELRRFASDDSPERFAALVDRLLASPGYGERWGRHWLDVARYSDAKGYVDAGEVRNPFAYTYRDYVIQAFNDDLAYDQFVREQIAADRMLSSEVVGQDARPLAALGFFTVGSRYNFFPHEIIDDRIDVVTRGFLGLTVQCARCHDHKFDPIPARDYYSLYGIFANSYEPTPDRAPRMSEPGTGENGEFQKKLAETAEKNLKMRRELHARMCHELRAWAGDYLRYIVQTTPEHRTEAQPALRTKRGLIREFSAYASGGVVRWRSYLASRMPDDPVWGMWNRLAKSTRLEIPNLYANELQAWSQLPGANRLVVDAFRDAKILNLADAADVYAALLESIDAKWREVLKASPDALRLTDAGEEEIRLVLYGPDTPGTIPVEELEDVVTLDESVEVRSHFAEIERVFLGDWQGVAPRPMLLRDKPQLHEQRIFVRGDSKRPGALAPRAIPATVTGGNPIEISDGSGRLELANAVANPRNPLTARVIVNRVWAWHFGNGLVTTPSDFGLRSEAPSHPELLDYLSRWFMQNGWSLKKLHRLLLTSETWQQASIDRPECRAVDPENKFLWRANRQRLDFETMRDAMLSVSGQLEPFAGGPPIEKSPDDPDNRARTIYSYVDREKLADVYRVFDFPSPDISAPERSKTTVPQQALFLLNNPFVAAQADGVAACAETDDDPVAKLYRRVLLRDPAPEERALAGRLLDDPQAGLRELAHALLLSNEFLFMD